jgi:hypothetical protein
MAFLRLFEAVEDLRIEQLAELAFDAFDVTASSISRSPVD